MQINASINDASQISILKEYYHWETFKLFHLPVVIKPLDYNVGTQQLGKGGFILDYILKRDRKRKCLVNEWNWTEFLHCGVGGNMMGYFVLANSS